MNVVVALIIAAHVWGPAPCGTPHVVVEAPPAAEFTQPEAVVGWTYPATSDCTIYLSNKMWLTWKYDPVFRCTVIVHEWGHLTGHGHSSDPNNVMYPSPTDYWRCKPPRLRHKTRVLKLNSDGTVHYGPQKEVQWT